MRADPRRLRLHQGLPGRKVLSRRQTLHDRRRHQRNPETRHCAPVAGEEIIGGCLLPTPRPLKPGPNKFATAKFEPSRAPSPQSKTTRPKLSRYLKTSFRKPATPASLGSPVRPAPVKARWSITSPLTTADKSSASASLPSIQPALTPAELSWAIVSAC